MHQKQFHNTYEKASHAYSMQTDLTEVIDKEGDEKRYNRT